MEELNIDEKKEEVLIVVLFNGGNHMTQPYLKKSAHDCLFQFRKFSTCRSLVNSKESYDAFIEKYGSPPFVNYFGSSNLPKEKSEDPFSDIDWIIDFNQVCAMYISDIPNKKKECDHDEEQLALQKEAIAISKELVSVMKNQVKDEQHGEEWRKKKDENEDIDLPKDSD